MPDNEFIDRLGQAYDADNDPYIPSAGAREAIEADYPQWQDAVENGLAEWESAALMAAFDVENPYDVSSIQLHHEGDDWTLNVTEGGDIHEIDLGDSLPFWVWDWLYDMADDFDWDWEIDYG